MKSLIASITLLLGISVMAQTTTLTGDGTGSTSNAPAFTTPAAILAAAGAGTAKLASDAYSAGKQMASSGWTNPIGAQIFGLQNGNGNYGGGILIEQHTDSAVNLGFAVAGVQTVKNGVKGWNFYDATINVTVKQQVNVPVINLPVTLSAFTGPFASLNGGVLIGLQSGTSADIHFRLCSWLALDGGVGVINCSGAAAEGLKPVMPLVHGGLTFNPLKNW